MSNSAILASRFREVILNGTWIAHTNFHDQLSNLDWKAATNQLGNLNSISILAQHIHYYIAGIKNVFTGGPLDIRDRFSFSFPPVESQEQWQAFLQKLWNDAAEFADLVEKMPEEQLTKHFVDEKYGTYQRNIDAMIEHSYYHLGQVVLLKKLLSNPA